MAAPFPQSNLDSSQRRLNRPRGGEETFRKEKQGGLLLSRDRRVRLAHTFNAEKCLNVRGSGKSSSSDVLRCLDVLETGRFMFLYFFLVMGSHPSFMEGGLLFHATLRSSISSKPSWMTHVVPCRVCNDRRAFMHKQTCTPSPPLERTNALG